VLFYCMDSRFYEKIEIFEIQNLNKIPSFTIFFYFFRIFGILFSISLIQKLWNFLWSFIGRVRDFTNDFWKILKVLLRKIHMWNIFFFQNSAILLFVFYFFIIFDILFSISSICNFQKILEIFIFFYFMD